MTRPSFRTPLATSLCLASTLQTSTLSVSPHFTISPYHSILVPVPITLSKVFLYEQLVMGKSVSIVFELCQLLMMVACPPSRISKVRASWVWPQGGPGQTLFLWSNEATGKRRDKWPQVERKVRVLGASFRFLLALEIHYFKSSPHKHFKVLLKMTQNFSLILFPWQRAPSPIKISIFLYIHTQQDCVQHCFPSKYRKYFSYKIY